MADFNIDAARKAGYSDDQIYQHLLQSNPGFNADAAMKAGYTKDQIMSHLASNRQAPSQETPSADRGFGSSLWQYTGEPMWNALQHEPSIEAFRNYKAGDYKGAMTNVARELFPALTAWEMGKAIAGQSADSLKKSFEAAKKGDVESTVGNALRATPVVGPIGGDIADKLNAGNYGGAAGAALGLAAPGLLAKAVSGAKVGPIVKNVNNPTEEAALQSLEKDVPMTVGQRTGQKSLQRVEQASANGEQFYPQQQAALAQKAEQLMGGNNVDPVSFGRSMNDRLSERFNKLKSQADRMYSSARQDLAANKKTVQTGTKPSSVLGPDGQPLATPTYATYETPVDIPSAQAGLKGMYEDLNRTLPEGRRAYSPAYQALKSLMEYPDKYMNAVDFDKYMSAVKSFVRDGSNPYMTDQSQGLAKRVVANGERALQDAMNGAGPDTLGKIQAGRRIVKSYHDTADMQDFLNNAAQEPAYVYDKLSVGRDRMGDTLSQLDKIAPQQVKELGSAYFQGMLDKAVAEGGFSRADGVLRDWQRLGPRTKELLYGPELSQQIDNFLLGAKRLTASANPSQSGFVMANLHKIMSVLKAGAGVISGNPKMALSGAAEAAPYLGAKMLFSPEGRQMLTTPHTIPNMTPTAEALNARFAVPPGPWDQVSVKQQGNQ